MESRRRPVKVLIVDPSASRYATYLEPRFPEAVFLTAAGPDDAACHLDAAEVLITIGPFLTEAFIDAMPRLQWIQAMIAGVDRFLQALTGRSEILLTSARGIHGPQMSEMALFHMLCLTRRVRDLVRNQDRRVWERFDPQLLHGKTVGIVGLGASGRALSHLCKALGMTVYGISRSRRLIGTIDRYFSRAELLHAAADVDFLVLTLPHTPETDKLINSAVLEAMKPTAFLVNVARGRVVDEDALIGALRSRQIAGAGLDVFGGGEDALPPDSELWSLENVLLTPHIAGRSDRYAEQVLTIIEPNLRFYLAGEPEKMINVIEADQGSSRETP